MRASSRHLLIASAPAAAAGLWNLGAQVMSLPLGAAGIWQLALIDRLGVNLETPGIPAAIIVGAAFWLPLFAIALLTCYLWSQVFSRVRDRPLDSEWLAHAWIFSLLLPATMPAGFAVLALSFGLIFGCHAFGGCGRYLVNPALLAVVFLAFAYPALTDTMASLPGGIEPTTWSIAAGGGVQALAAETGLLDAFLGHEVGAVGTTSGAAICLGALYLIAVRCASAGLIAAGVAAVIFTGAALGDLPWPWQLALGNFSFALAFVATDPTTKPRTVIGTIVFGALFGSLTIILRTADPAHPEGTWAALLLASLFIPLIDHAVTHFSRDTMPYADNAGGVPN